MPLQKKLGGIRPLVVGELFRLLTGKVFMGLYGSMLGDALHKSRQCSPHAHRRNLLKTYLRSTEG